MDSKELEEYFGYDLSIVIITYNRATLLKGLLEHLCKQIISPGEVIIVDNNSNDNTKEVIKAFESLLPIKYVLEVNQGVSFARNAGVKVSSKKIVCFVDDDCRPEETWTKHILDSYNALDEISILGGPVIPVKHKNPSILDRFFYDLYSY